MMLQTIPGLMDEIRNRFCHVEQCPIEGPRVFFENAGGALTLKSVVETTAKYAAIPDNQGRDNPASKELVRVIAKARADTQTFLAASSGQVIFGESGTEVLFRLIRNAIVASDDGGDVIGSTLEHPASRSAAMYWAEQTGRRYVEVAHDDDTGTVLADAYAAKITPDTRVATIIHTSPVTGMGVDVAAISAAVRKVAPDCLIIVDGIQHAAHGGIDIDSYGIDGYAMSSYKVFSRHGYGVGWLSDSLSAMPHEKLTDGPAENWELGTRDTGAYATFSDVVDHFSWLGTHFTDATDTRARIEAAAAAIHQHERDLTNAMLHGTGNLKGLCEMEQVNVIGGADNPSREGLVSLTVDEVDSAAVVEKLRRHGVRVHIRKDDHYSGNILKPLGLQSCIRVSMCHYNTIGEVAQFLTAMRSIAGDD